MSITFEALVAIIVRALTAEAEQQHGPLGTAITVGRPVTFVDGEDAEADAFGVRRLHGALEACGFTDITFEYEPAGAAHYYGRTLDRDELVLIADFGGGTSDFSLVRVGPARVRHGSGRNGSSAIRVWRLRATVSMRALFDTWCHRSWAWTP